MVVVFQFLALSYYMSYYRQKQNNIKELERLKSYHLGRFDEILSNASFSRLKKNA
jgi:hypothetical protein